MRICFFWDHDLWHKRDSAGRNKVGYITRHNFVVYAFRTGVKVAPLTKIGQKKLATMVTVPLSSDLEEKIETFFTENVLNSLLFQMGLKALAALISSDSKFLDDPHAFFQKPIYLPKLKPVEKESYETRWRECISLLMPGDIVSALDESSFISRLIARIDKGTWSHTAVYLGNGRIAEVITTGGIERNIEVYKDPKYRLGIYRHRNATQDQLTSVVNYSRINLNVKYAWRKAARLGIRKMFGIPIRDYKSSDTSPNDLVVLYGMNLIFVL